MLITCPNCLAQFEVEASLLRHTHQAFCCSACNHTFKQRIPLDIEKELFPEVEVIESETPDFPNFSFETRYSALPEVFQPVHNPHNKKVLFLIVVLLFLLVLCFSLLGLVITKTDFFKKIQEKPVYQLIQASKELSILNLSSETVPEGESQRLIIKGSVQNKTARIIDLPSIVVELYNQKNILIKRLMVPFDSMFLGAYATEDF